jgi:HPt (histidine-containing phosphotransfer) domain-containing protein
VLGLLLQTKGRLDNSGCWFSRMIDDGEQPGKPCVGFSELLARMEDDRELVRDLLGIFSEEFPPTLRSLQEAVACGDMKKVETAAHSLKGMMSTLAFERAADAARRIEQMGRPRNL